jgi:trk system potassium uptake protein TrkA
VKIIICGCGKVGSKIIEIMLEQKHTLTVIDRDADVVRQIDAIKLEAITDIQFITGNIVDQDILVKAGIENADVFLALTNDDNANILSAQVAKELFKVKRVIASVKDPVRARAFTDELGLDTICGTDLIAEQIKKKIGVK